MSTISGPPAPIACPRRKYRGRRRLNSLIAVYPPHGGLAFAGNGFRRSDPKQARVSRNPRTLDCADQAMQRHTLHSCSKIPQRDVEPGDRKHRNAIATEQMQIALDPIHESRNALGHPELRSRGPAAQSSRQRLS